ncbi:MAG TPA: TraB/GumN family protein [Novosphingobium sp.]|nr:TraB/GumN family protein [Novosphingobium sp.]
MTMTKNIRFVAAAGLLALLGTPPLTAKEAAPSRAEAPAAATVAAAQTPPVPVPAKPALWKIADADTTIYLFGTIHILPEATQWYSGPVAQAFNSSQMLVTEAIVDSPAELQKEFMAKAVRTDGTTLRQSLPEKERAALEKAADGLGIPAEALDRFKPWYAALLLSTLPMQNAGYKADNGVEAQIEALAKEHGLKREALETPAYQIGLFDSLPPDAQTRYLDDVLRQLPTLREDLARLIAAWKAGRPDDLAKILNADESDERVRKVLLSDRNAAWAKWLKARLDQPGTIFVAVGAGHLAGEDSVQDQLAAEGVASTRLQ